MFAAIDIGTNSVLLLIGEPQADGSARVVEDRTEVTRLGQGLTRRNLLLPEAAERTMQTLVRYKALCDHHGIGSIAAVGTAALRTAANATEFLERARAELGLEIEVIDAEREAWLTYQASEHDFGRDIVVLDVGGGSTELITRRRPPHGDEGLAVVSLPVGSVVLTEEFLKSDPVASGEFARMRASVHTLLESRVSPAIFARPHDLQLVATAGTATTLMAMHQKLTPYRPEAVHGTQLKIDDLRDLIDLLQPRTVEERRQLPGLMPERADVILAGAELTQELMSYLGYSSVVISDRGVKWGLFYEKYCGMTMR